MCGGWLLVDSSILILFFSTHLLKSFSRGKKVALFLSDIVGAFDRVSADLLVQKLRRTGLNEALVQARH